MTTRGIKFFTFAALTWFGVSAAAFAEMSESMRQMPTDSAATDLFILNPAALKPNALHLGLFLIRNEKKSSLDMQSSNDDKITSKTKEDYAEIGLSADLGAGAGVAVSHELMFRDVATSLASDDSRDEPREERLKQQHSTLKLLIELTNELRAGLAIRYLYKDFTILGSTSLGAGESTRYKTTMIGYGSGFAYYFGNVGALSYTYFPPLRGKTEIYGEEFLIVEPGFISVDGFYEPNPTWRFGLLGKRWLNEIDERARGTTAADDETDISIYGLDVDQYVFQQQLVMLGVDYSLSKDTIFKASIGQETAEFNFRDLARYNQVRVDQGSGSPEQTMRYYRARAALRFGSPITELQIGVGLFKRDHDFPDSMRGASYESSGQEVFAILGMKI